MKSGLTKILAFGLIYLVKGVGSIYEAKCPEPKNFSSKLETLEINLFYNIAKRDATIVKNDAVLYEKWQGNYFQQ